MDILTFLNKKPLDLAIHKKYLNGNLLLYRDVRRFLYFSEAIWIVAFPAAAFLSDKTPLIVMNALPLWVVAGAGLWFYFVKHIMHGAILLNKGYRQIEIRKDIRFQTPSKVYPIDSIEKISIRRHRGSARRGTHRSFYVALHLKGESEGREVNLSLSETEAESIARIMARFAKVSAFDWEEYQIWPEVEEDSEEDGEEAEDETVEDKRGRESF